MPHEPIYVIEKNTATAKRAGRLFPEVLNLTAGKKVTERQCLGPLQVALCEFLWPDTGVLTHPCSVLRMSPSKLYGLYNRRTELKHTSNSVILVMRLQLMAWYKGLATPASTKASCLVWLHMLLLWTDVIPSQLYNRWSNIFSQTLIWSRRGNLPVPKPNYVISC